MLRRKQQLCVLHVAARHDGEAVATLRRTADAIATEGLRQVLVVLDDGRDPDAPSPLGVAAEVSAIRCAGLSVVGKVRALQLELTKLSYERTPYAVHLHGLSACLLGLQALKGSPVEARVFYSPHWTPLRRPWTSLLLGRLLQAGAAPAHCLALAGSATEAQALSKLLNRSVEMLPHAVSDVFFASPRKEESRATIVAEGCGARAAELASRLCVLFNSREARVPFCWLGGTDGESRARLAAANVQVLDAADDAERAQALSRASLFLYVSPREQAPHAVAQAMAAGLPALVSDTLAHRAVVRHGETGYVCTSERDFVEKITVLLRDRAERKRLGEAARAEAERRFTLRHFETAVLRAYGFRGGRPLEAAAIERAAPAAARVAVPRVV